MRRYDLFKRLLDSVIAAGLILVTLPLQIVIAAWVRVCLGKPVFFRQPRPGKDEQLFHLVKFRTMREPDPTTGLLSDEDRMTPLGGLLRATSLDELPSLWNVLVGEMSLVGPRPLLVRYLDRYSSEQRRRHDVRPGITGLAQVNGRNAISWEQKLALDVEYVDKRSFALDMAIVGRTIGKVLSREGVSADGRATTDEFMGAQR